jgi:hypothetical protein
MTALLRRPPTVEDVGNILCGPMDTDLPDDQQTRTRIRIQASINTEELVLMFTSIVQRKEADEWERQALERTLRYRIR